MNESIDRTDSKGERSRNQPFVLVSETGEQPDTEVMGEKQKPGTMLKKNEAGAVWFNHLPNAYPASNGRETASKEFPVPTVDETGTLAGRLTSAPAAQSARSHSPMPLEKPVPVRDVLNHSNFGLLPQEKHRLGFFGVSLAVNGLIAAAVLILTVSTIHEARVREQKLELTFLAQPKPYVPPPVKVKLPPIPRIEPPKLEVAKIVPPRPTVTPEPPKVEPVKIETKAPAIPIAAPRPVVQPPAPVVGAFRTSTPAPATATKVASVTRPAGFGDPSGVAPNPNANRAATVAAVGGFGAANSAAEGSGPRRGVVQGAGFGAGLGAGSPNGSTHGVVSAVGFGSGSQTAGTPGGHGTVATTGFGAGAPAANQPSAKTQQPVTTALIVISKPLPRYTAEARELRIQGDVTLEVRFSASGTVEVLRVVNGLGHGLDEEARLAAQQIRFKPATRDGKPIDQVSIIHVAFQMA